MSCNFSKIVRDTNLHTHEAQKPSAACIKTNSEKLKAKIQKINQKNPERIQRKIIPDVERKKKKKKSRLFITNYQVGRQ